MQSVSSSAFHRLVLLACLGWGLGGCTKTTESSVSAEQAPSTASLVEPPPVDGATAAALLLPDDVSTPEAVDQLLTNYETALERYHDLSARGKTEEASDYLNAAFDLQTWLTDAQENQRLSRQQAKRMLAIQQKVSRMM